VQLLCASSLLAACSVQGSAFQKASLPRTKSAVYVYRTYKIVGAALSPTIKCGEESSAIGPGGYHVFLLDPGKIFCGAEGEEGSSFIAIDAVAGQEYYVKAEENWGVIVGKAHIMEVGTAIGQSEIQECSLQ
jgi:hypothetical protein